MKKLGLAILLLPLIVLLAGLGLRPPRGVDVRRERSIWQLPAAGDRAAPVPMLARPPVIDGALDEWPGAMCTLLCSSFDLARRHEAAGEWRGPQDASMLGLAAWTADGLCLAAVVADNDVRNDRKGPSIWQQDCVQVFVDGRAGGRFMKPPYSDGCRQFVLKPPTGSGPAAIEAGPGYADAGVRRLPAGCRVAGSRTPTGYTLEACVPWSAFPDLRPAAGTQIALQFLLVDCDARDGPIIKPRTFSWRGADKLFARPQNLERCSLVRELQPGPLMSLDMSLVIQVPKAVGDVPAVPLVAQMVPWLAERARSVSFTVVDTRGRVLLDRTVPVERMSPPWQSCGHAMADWSLAEPLDGACDVRVKALAADSAILGTTSQPVLVAAESLCRLKARLCDANLPAVARNQPYRAASWLPIAAGIERIEIAVEEGDEWRLGEPRRLGRIARELAARLDVLDGRPAPRDRLLDLLTLTADPDAQVVVEYESRNEASVTFYCGSIPMATARANHHANAKLARDALDANDEWFLACPSQQVTLDGLPARLVEERFDREPFDLADFSPDTQLFRAFPVGRRILAFDADYLQFASVDAAAILDNCPAAMSERVRRWARDSGVRIVPFRDALSRSKVVIAGDIRPPGLIENFESYNISVAVPSTFHAVRLSVLKGNRVVKTWGPTAEACSAVARLVLSPRRPVSRAESDALRRLIVHELAPDIAPRRAAGLFCGDIHMHTFYSDGEMSPVGMALLGMSNYEDFLVITDHNTLEGARLAHRLLRRHRLSFGLFIGEEITTDWGHFNAWPLTGWISPALCLDAMVAAAHGQGAMIQWNHPGYTDSGWSKAHLKTGLAGTGLDAWEHVPAHYDDWRLAGTLPTITGSTDAHHDVCTFFPERTIAFAGNRPGTSPSAHDVAAAVREGRALAVVPNGRELFYGRSDLVSAALAALAEGDGLREGNAARIRAALEDADIPGLLDASPPRRLESEPAAPASR